jgi:hypothetical protein
MTLPIPGADGLIDEKPYRVYEFWSSADPGKKVRMLAEGVDIATWRMRSDFIRDVTAQTAPIQPTLPTLEDDDEAVFPNDTNLAIIHKDRYWMLCGFEDVCAELDVANAPVISVVEARPDLASLPRYAEVYKGGNKFELEHVPNGHRHALLYVADVERLLNPTGETK